MKRALPIAAIMLSGLFVAATASAEIPPSENEQTIRISGMDISVLTYRPNCSPTGLLLVFHGALRNPKTSRKAARPLADRLCLIVVAPKFDRETFPSSSYQRGGIVERRYVQDPRQWTGNIVLELADWARRQERRKLDYYLIGHSAGGQFLSRVAAYVPTEAKRIVVANPSTYVSPTLEVNAPYGMGGVFSGRAAELELRRYLAAPVTVFLGQEDTGERMLAKGRRARAQGETRYERGLNIYAAGEKLARSRKWAFNWRLVEVPGVGHNARKMYSSPQAVEALRP